MDLGVCMIPMTLNFSHRFISRILCMLVLVLPVVASTAETRTALVIGNGAYRTAPLANPVNDAREMAKALRGFGFEVVHKQDLDKREMTEAVREFTRLLQKRGGAGLFFYAGHAAQIKGRNYLIPMRADIRTEADIEYEAFDLGRLLAHVEQAGNDLNIVVLDACRDNPFGRSFRSVSRGLARVDAPTGSIIAYATAPGKTAADGSGRNSPYTRHLLAAMHSPGLSIEQVLKQTRINVMRDTGNRQIPWESSSLTGEFYFSKPGGERKPQVSPPLPATAEISVDNRSSYKGKRMLGDKEYDWWSWTIFVKADRAELEKIDCVEYTLHRTFRDPVRTVCDREDGFSLSMNGWGTFRVKVRVMFREGGEKTLYHRLYFSR